MSMPELPKVDPDLTREQALNMILSSIAMEEVALSHIINAEGEKIQYILSGHGNFCTDSEDILAVNKSVTNLLEVVMQNQMLLKGKMEKVLEHLPNPSPAPKPADPSPSPLPAPGVESVYCMSPCRAVDFELIPGTIYCGGALSWHGQTGGCGAIRRCPENATQIILPRFSSLQLSFVAQGCRFEQSRRPIVLELQLACGEKLIASKSFCQNGNNCSGSSNLGNGGIGSNCRTASQGRFTLSGSAVIHQGCSISIATVFLRSPHKIQTEKGRITFSCT